MPDHVNLFVRGDYNFRLGTWIGALKQAVAKAAMLSRAKGQVWQEGFFDHVLRTDESYSQKWKYVCENPVRAGLVKSAADWLIKERSFTSIAPDPVATGLWPVRKNKLTTEGRPTGPWLQHLRGRAAFVACAKLDSLRQRKFG